MIGGATFRYDESERECLFVSPVMDRQPLRVVP